MKMPSLKFDELNYLNEVKKYIFTTYNQHYASDEQQTFEVIDSAGWGDGFAIGNIMKYASRYGKKAGYQRKDLIKIIHYALLQLYVHDNHPRDEGLTREHLLELMKWYPKIGKAYWKVNKGNNRKGKLVGNTSTGGYRRVRIDGKDYRFSRIVYMLEYGVWPEHEADHENHDPSDDRAKNIRDLTPSENTFHRRLKPGKAGLRGVTLRGKKYQSRITVNKKEINLGTYDTPMKAHNVWRAAAKKHFGRVIKGNK